MKLGKYVSSKGGIGVGGADQYILWSVFAANDKPVLLTQGQFWSGDASEQYKIAMIPASSGVTFSNDAYTLADFNGAMSLGGGALRGGVGTVADPANVFGHSGTAEYAYNFLIPPFWRVVVMSVTAGGSAADFGMIMGGFEVEA